MADNQEPSSTAALIEQMAKMMTQMAAMQAAAMSTSAPPTAPQIESNISSSAIEIKFDGTNYTIWCQAVEMYVRGRDRLHHLTEPPPPLKPDEAAYRRWATDDVIVKQWMINSLELRLKGSYMRHPTAREVWKAIATTYFDESDEAQVYALNRQVSQVKQDGRPIEEYYAELQGLWQEIDFRCPNPMECTGDITKFNTFVQKTRVYMLLDGLDDTLDSMRAQVVLLRPFPTIEQAYGFVRREAARKGIMLKGGSELNSVAMVSRGYNSVKVFNPQNKTFPIDKSKMKCTVCGKHRHTKEQCFEVIGYPEWWKGDKKKRGGEKAIAASTVALPVISTVHPTVHPHPGPGISTVQPHPQPAPSQPSQ